MAGRKRLSAADWTEAGYRALATGGVAAVAVEVLATQLGATKGSFYWHFTSRDELLDAVLQYWERAETENTIALVDSESDVLIRLRSLITIALGGHPTLRAGTVELALQATADHPLVAPVLARVTRRRISYLADQFVLLGFDPPDARQRGLAAYTAYLGHAQLVHATPDAAPTGSDLQAYVDALIAMLSRP